MRKTMAWEARLARELGRPERLAVLGVGNVSRGDDAVGVRCAEALAGLVGYAANPRFKILIAHEAPENFTGSVRFFAPSHVLIIDATAGGYPPGTIFSVDPSAIPKEDLSTHRIPLSKLAAYLKTTVGCRVLVLGVEPGDFDWGGGLTPAVQAAADLIVKFLVGFAGRQLRSS